MSRLLLFLAPLWLLSCGHTPLEIRAHAVASGVEVVADSAVDRIELRTLEGQLLGARNPHGESSRVWVGLSWSGHQRIVVLAQRGEEQKQVVVSAPAPTESIRVSAPLGQDEQTLREGQVVHFPSIEGSDNQVGVAVIARSSEPVSIQFGSHRTHVAAPVPGQKIQLTGAISTRTPVSVTIGATTTQATMAPRILTEDEARQQLEIIDVRFPTDFRGHTDLARAGQRITIPGRWWSRFLQVTHLGFRPHDRTIPWAHQAVTLYNHGDTALNVGVQARVTHDGEPDPIFTPWMRDVEDGTGWASALLRVPPQSEAIAVLPLFVDEQALSEDNRTRGERIHTVAVSPLGSTVAFSQQNEPLPIHRGSSLASLVMALGLLASAGGTILLWWGIPRWLREIPTTGLVTISLFSTLAFVAGTAAQLLGMGVASLLGPFAFILTGLLDDTVRACLLATLLVLRPRTGVCALAVIIGWLLRAVATGAASPSDLLYLTGHVFLLESALWLFGLTRPDSGWLKATATGQWMRLSMAFIASFSASIGIALAFNVVLYRLFYAPWYVALNVLLSGAVYPALAMALAVPFARSLRAVED